MFPRTSSLVSYYHRGTCPDNFTRAEINCLTSHSLFQNLLTIRPPCKTQELSTLCLCVSERSRRRLEQPVLISLDASLEQSVPFMCLNQLSQRLRARPDSSFSLFSASLFLLFLCLLFLCLFFLLPFGYAISSIFFSKCTESTSWSVSLQEWPVERRGLHKICKRNQLDKVSSWWDHQSVEECGWKGCPGGRVWATACLWVRL